MGFVRHRIHACTGWNVVTGDNDSVELALFGIFVCADVAVLSYALADALLVSFSADDNDFIEDNILSVAYKI